MSGRHNYSDIAKGYAGKNQSSAQNDRDGNFDKYYHGWGADKDKQLPASRESTFVQPMEGGPPHKLRCLTESNQWPEIKIKQEFEKPETTDTCSWSGMKIKQEFEETETSDMWSEMEIKQEFEETDNSVMVMSTPSPPKNQWPAQEINQDFEEVGASADMMDMIAPPPPNISNTREYDFNKPPPEPPRNINWVEATEGNSDDLFSAKCKENRCFFNPDPNDVMPPNLAEVVDNDSNSRNNIDIDDSTDGSKAQQELTRRQNERFQKALKAGFSSSDALQICEHPFVKVGFIPNPSTIKSLHSGHLGLLREAIQHVQAHSNFKTEILRFYPLGGWIKVTCTDNTALWLKSNIQHIRKICKLNINVVDEADFPSTLTIRGNFPNSIHYSSAEVLALIKAHNDLDVSCWKLVHRNNKKSLRNVITFEVDKDSWSKLLKMNGLITYRFVQIKLELNEITNCSKGESNETSKSSNAGSITNEEMLPLAPPRRTVRANFPHSHAYTSAKVLAIIKVQNALDVSQWKSRERKSDELYFTFDVDDGSWLTLQKLNGLISYRFGQIKLEMIESTSSPELKNIANATVAPHQPEKPTSTARLVRGNFPFSHSYTNEKVLALIKAQNELNVSLWKPVHGETQDTYFTFEVDENSWHKLQRLGGLISYRFGQMKLEMIYKNNCAVQQSDQVVKSTKNIKAIVANQLQKSPQSSRYKPASSRRVRGDFPFSHEYSNAKVLALIKTQNNLDVSQWKPLPRQPEDSHFTFEVDDSSWHKLLNLEGLISYRFGQIKLELIDANSASSNNKITDTKQPAYSPQKECHKTDTEKSRLDELKSRIALRYEQMQIKSNDHGVGVPRLNPQKAQAPINVGRRVSPQKPYEKPQTSYRNIENNNPLTRLAELKSRIASRYDRMQVNINDNTASSDNMSHTRWSNDSVKQKGKLEHYSSQY